MIVCENPLEIERIWTRVFQQRRHPNREYPSSDYTARDLLDTRGTEFVQVDPTVRGGITE